MMAHTMEIHWNSKKALTLLPCIGNISIILVILRSVLSYDSGNYGEVPPTNKGRLYGSTNKTEIMIPVGIIYSPQDQQIRSAIKLKLREINNEPTRRFGINFLENITDVSNSFKVADSLCYQMSIGVFLFFGVKDLKSIDIVESYTDRFHVPFVSPTLTRVKNVNSSYQIHMKPPYTQAIIDMIKHYQWKVLPYVYDSNEGLQRFYDVFHALYKDPSLTINVFPVKLDDFNHAHEILRSIDEMEHVDLKTIAVDLSSLSAYQSIIRQIAEVGMNKDGYFYLFTCLDFSKLDFTRFIHGGVNVTGFDLIDPRGSTKVVKDFLQQWRIANPNIYPSAGELLLSESALAVDALDAIVLAINAMIQEDFKVFQKNFRRQHMYNHFGKNESTPGIPCNRKRSSDPLPQPWQHGAAILKSLKSVEFTGLTGPISFREGGYRKDFNLHVTTVGYKQPPIQIGMWHSGRGYDSSQTEPIHDHTNETEPHEDELIVTTILSQPYLMYKNLSLHTGPPPTGNDRYEGYIVDLVKYLEKDIGIKLKLTLVKDNKYGEEIENKKWNGMVGELLDKKADLAVAPLTINWAREKVIDFTKPFMEVGISIMIKKPEIEKPGVFSFMKPFSLNIWMFILLAYTAVSIGLFLVSRFSPYEWKTIFSGREMSYENEFSLVNSFWFSTGALMLQGSDSCPRSMSGRIIGTVWWFFVLIIISTYTANLAAFLTIERLVTPIESADELAKQTEIKYGTVNSGTTKQFFIVNQVDTYSDMGKYMLNNEESVMVNRIEDGIKKVRDSKGKYAFLVESTMNEYENSREPCDTMKVGRNLNAEGYGIATPVSSPYRDRLNLAVLMLQEDGTLHTLKRRWWQDKSQCSDGGKDAAGKRSLSLSNVAGVFYILIGGLGIAVIVGAFEMIFKRLHLVPKLYYETESSSNVRLLRSSSERENGDVPENGVPDNGIESAATALKPLPSIGFEAFNDRNTHTNV